MRYMVQLINNPNKWVCFNDEETKQKYEHLGYVVIDMDNWSF